MQFFVVVNHPFRIWIMMTLAIGLGHSWQGKAQMPELYWKHFSINNGLPSLDTRCIKLDSRGLLWMGTAEGPVYFDGIHFIPMPLPADDIPNFKDNVIHKTEEDSQGNLVFCTGNGVVILDRKSGRTQRKRFSIQNSNPGLSNNIRGIMLWGADSLWASSWTGVISWNRATDEVKMLGAAFDTEINGEDNPFIFSPEQETCYILLRGKLGLYDTKTGQLNTVSSQFDRTGELYEQRDLLGFAIDAQGTLWYASISDSALYSYDTQTGIEREFKVKREVGGVTEPVYAITISTDSRGRVWMTSWNEFPLVFDPQTATWSKILYNVNDPFGMPHGAIRAMVETPSGDIWAAHSNGVSMHSPVMEASMKLPVPRFSDKQESPWYGVNCMLEDPQTGRLFAGTNQLGLIVYEATFSDFKVHTVFQGDYRANTISSLIQVNNDVWCGTAKGLYKFDLERETFTLFDPFKDGIFHSTGIYEMVRVGSTIWFNCRGALVYGYDLESGQSAIVPTPVGDDQSMIDEFCPYMIATSDGQLCFGHNKGYSFMNPKTGLFRHFIIYPEPLEDGNHPVSGLTEAYGSIWYLPRGDGLFKVNPKTGERKKVLERTDHPFGELYGLQASEGRLWVGTSKGIAFADTVNRALKLFKFDHSVFRVFFFSGFYPLKDGRLLAYINHHLLAIDPTFHDRTFPISPPVVSSIISGGPVLPVLDGKIELDSDHNYVTFRFSSLSDAGRDDIEYAIMLEGWDRERVMVGSQTSASYNNLRGGTYTFRVWARAGDSPWVECATPLALRIEKTFPETLGFKAVVLAVLIGILWLIVRLRKRVEGKMKREKAVRHFTSATDDRSPEDLARDIVKSAVETLRMKAAALYMRDEKTGNYTLSAQATDEQPVETPTSFPEEIAMRESAETAASNPIQIPILHKGEALAILSVWVNEKSQDREADLNALREIAAVCGDKFAAARAQEEVKHKEELLTRINALLAESQLASLRAQMNPHFVFNCLNSIQEFIIMKNYAEASHYLNKFSKLFRQVLQNSSQSLIPLSEEISVLRLYLELEHMRFQGAFEFTIQCDEELETDEIMIPSMLLQPFVENSLWHGLMHKESDRRLSLRFFPKNDDVFVCEIEDNGIGREKAAEIKKHKSGNEKHKSRGIGIAMDRLRLIRLQQGQHATIDIIDLHDADGQATGTRVVCELSSFLHQSPNP